MCSRSNRLSGRSVSARDALCTVLLGIRISILYYIEAVIPRKSTGSTGSEQVGLRSKPSVCFRQAARYIARLSGLLDKVNRSLNRLFLVTKHTFCSFCSLLISNTKCVKLSQSILVRQVSRSEMPAGSSTAWSTAFSPMARWVKANASLVAPSHFAFCNHARTSTLPQHVIVVASS